MARGVKGSGVPRNRKPKEMSAEPYGIQVAKAGGLKGPVHLDRSPSIAFPIGTHIEPPNFLDDVARSEWSRIATLQGRFAEKGFAWITEFDLAILASYCTSWSVWVRAAEAVMDVLDSGLTEVNEKGMAVERAELRIERESKKQLIAAAKELGLSSMVRSRIQAQMMGSNKNIMDDDELLS